MRFAWHVKVVPSARPEFLLHTDRGLEASGEDAYWAAVCAVEDWFGNWAEDVVLQEGVNSIVILIGVSKETSLEADVVTAITMERLQRTDPFPDLFTGLNG